MPYFIMSYTRVLTATNSSLPDNFSDEESDSPTFKVDTSKHYKIWFSKSRDTFLGFENQLRFAKMRNESPDIKITFIYSASCLSEYAMNRLNVFCKNNNILAVNFDDIDSNCMSNQEKILYSRAKEEIAKTIADEGGNMAAASDCARFIIPIIEKYGIYSDFDVHVKVLKNDSGVAAINAPLAFSYLIFPDTGETIWNNDILAVAHNPENPNRIISDAYARIRRLQKVIIDNYNNFFTTMDSYFNERTLNDFSYERLIYIYLLSKLEAKPDDIYAFRKSLETLSFDAFQAEFTSAHWDSFLTLQKLAANLYSIDNALAWLKLHWNTIKSNLYSKTVELITGPKNIYELMHAEVNAASKLVNSGLSFAHITAETRPFSIEYSDLDGHFLREDTENHTYVPGSSMQENRLGSHQDSSWTEDGRKQQVSRNKTLAAEAILQAWKRFSLYAASSAGTDAELKPAAKATNSNTK